MHASIINFMATLTITDLTILIFTNILKIDPLVLSKYPIPQDKIVYLLFIPHIILFLFIFGFMKGVAPGSRGLQYLVGLGAYVYTVYSGLYGKTLVGLFLGFWELLLFLGIFFFLASRIVHPARVREIFEVGKAVGAKATAKGKLEKELWKQIESLNHQINQIQSDYPPGRPMPDLVRHEIAALRRKAAELEHKARNL